MRLRECAGIQRLALNPFGSYHGRQLDYHHLDGNGLGAEFTAAASGSLRPNGPSFNGQHLSFSLLLAPYSGDEPPPRLQRDALAFFYPPGVVYLHTPPEVDALLPGDVRHLLEADRHARRRETMRGLPPDVPGAFLANPAPGALDLVWEPPDDEGLTGYEVCWRLAGDEDWQCRTIPPGRRWQVAGLQDGRAYRFRLRALAEDGASPWTVEAEAVPGAVQAASLLSMMPSTSPRSLLHLVAQSIASVIRARF
jgi:hypothetical protein